MELYAKKCSKTGKGFFEGFKVGDEFFELRKDANEYCIKEFEKTFEELYNEMDELSDIDNSRNFCYYSSWDDDDIKEQGFGYTEKGKKYYIKKENLNLILDKFIKEQYEFLEKEIRERAEEQGYSGEDSDLFDYNYDHNEDIGMWDREVLENHAFALGKYWQLKELETDIINQIIKQKK